MTQTTDDVAIFSTLNQDDFTHSEIKRAEIHSMAAMDVVTQYGSIAAKLRGQTPFAIHGWTSILVLPKLLHHMYHSGQNIYLLRSTRCAGTS